MPNDGCRTLAEYISELVAELGAADPAALARMREVVGRRRARITLDDESVEVQFGDGVLVGPAGTGDVDGAGTTDRQTVLDLLDGYLSVSEAIVDGRLNVVGPTEEVHRMFVAIEILLDGAARAPTLQRLARDFRADPCRPPRGRPVGPSTPAGHFPPPPPADEDSLLARLDLLA